MSFTRFNRAVSFVLHRRHVPKTGFADLGFGHDKRVFASPGRLFCAELPRFENAPCMAMSKKKTNSFQNSDANPPLASQTYTLQFDGSASTQGRSGAGITIFSHAHISQNQPQKQKQEQEQSIFSAGFALQETPNLTRNEACYHALLLGLHHLPPPPPPHANTQSKVLLQTDNDLVVSQLTGVYKCKSPNLKPLYKKVMTVLDHLEQYEVCRIDKKENACARSLASQAVDSGQSVIVHSQKDQDENENENKEEKEERLPISKRETVRLHSTLATITTTTTTSHPPPTINPNKTYLLQFDGGSRGNPGIAGAGMVLYNLPSNHHHHHNHPSNHQEYTPPSPLQELWSAKALLPNPQTTNNQAEYTALVLGLQSAYQMGIRHLVVGGDSQLVIHQYHGVYQCHDGFLRKLLEEVKRWADKFESLEMVHVRRRWNGRADQLANEAMDG